MRFPSNRFTGWFQPFWLKGLSFIWYYPADLVRMAWLEFLISMSIVMVLAVIALSSYTEYLHSFRIANAVLGSPFSEIKADMMVCRANTGQWPDDSNQSSQWGLQESYAIQTSRYLDAIQIEKGAIHFTLAGAFAGKTVTMRPAVPDQDPFGPVVWFCASPLDNRGWTMAGVDRTDVPERYIPIKLR